MRRALLPALLLLFPFVVSAVTNPVITGITPSTQNNLLQTISGSGFQVGAQVYVGGVASASTWVGGTQFIVFEVPAGGSGTVDVKVLNPDGGSATLTGGFTYSSSAVLPVIRGVAPSETSTILKTVWGENFEKGAKVYVNDILAPSQWQIGTQFIVFQPPTSIPSGSSVVVKVVNPGGGSASLTANLSYTTYAAAATSGTSGSTGSQTSSGSSGSSQTTTAAYCQTHTLSSPEAFHVEMTLEFAPITPDMRKILEEVHLTNKLTCSQKQQLDRDLDSIAPGSSRLFFGGSSSDGSQVSSGTTGTSGGTTGTSGGTTSTGSGSTGSSGTPYTVSGGYPMLTGGQTNVCGGTRNVYKQPFAPTSIWNMPIGSGAQYVPIGWDPTPSSWSTSYNNKYTFYPLNQKTSDGLLMWIQVSGGDRARDIMRASAPLTDVHYIDYNTVTGTGGSCYSPSSAVAFRVPWPADYYIPLDPSDAMTSVLMSDGRTVAQFDKGARCQVPGYILSANDPPVYTDICGDGIKGTHGASGLSALGGVLRVGEFTKASGPARHALAITPSVYWMNECAASGPGEVNDQNCSRWPAPNKGPFAGEYTYYGRDNPNYAPAGANSVLATTKALRMGALLAIPANIDINNMGLQTEPGKMLAWTMQNYGAYVSDTFADGPGFRFYTEEGPDGSFWDNFHTEWGMNWGGWVRDIPTDPFLGDFAKILRALAVVNNNGPTSVGGGGTPRQPLAPL